MAVSFMVRVGAVCRLVGVVIVPIITLMVGVFSCGVIMATVISACRCLVSASTK
ncbi:MAG: hypothetical protein PF961_17290 [Planctomycetota bacterium]|jgi:hypothetical protein|nr:hypothetical protein [Planctomycetota bacterium]